MATLCRVLGKRRDGTEVDVVRHRQGLSDYGLNSNWRTFNDALHYSTVCKTNVNYAGQPKRMVIEILLGQQIQKIYIDVFFSTTVRYWVKDL